MHTVISFLKHPKKLLLLDSMGAFATALTIYFVFASEVLITGLPVPVHRIMVLLAMMFACFDLLAYRYSKTTDIPLFLIASLNLSYCVLTSIAMSMNWKTVTWLGLLYFGVEIIVISSLALWEFVIARRVRNNRVLDASDAI
jgi:uncharacterized membrane protein